MFFLMLEYKIRREIIIKHLYACYESTFLFLGNNI